jgi:hypothetical protein
MQDKIIILKNTKNGIVKDTIMSIQDTIHLNLKNLIKLQQPDDNLIIHTISEPLSNIEIVGIWAGAILAVITIIYTLISTKKLLSNDEQLQSQIDELTNLNTLFERRLRMNVKPYLWSNGLHLNSHTYEFYIQIDNRGEIAFYKDFEILEGENSFSIQKWNMDVTINKGENIRLSGRTNRNPEEANFKIKILYSDKENYDYETIIEWDKGVATFLETIEL